MLWGASSRKLNKRSYIGFLRGLSFSSRDFQCENWLRFGVLRLVSSVIVVAFLAPFYLLHDDALG